MADAFGATVVGDDINVISHSLAVADVIAFALGVAPRFENCFIGTFG
jgi:hypothetical protein